MVARRRTKVFDLTFWAWDIELVVLKSPRNFLLLPLLVRRGGWLSFTYLYQIVVDLWHGGTGYRLPLPFWNRKARFGSTQEERAPRDESRAGNNRPLLRLRSTCQASGPTATVRVRFVLQKRSTPLFFSGFLLSFGSVKTSLKKTWFSRKIQPLGGVPEDENFNGLGGQGTTRIVRNKMAFSFIRFWVKKPQVRL